MPRAATWAWTLASGAVASTAGFIVIAAVYRQHIAVTGGGNVGQEITSAFAGIAFPLVGAVIASRRPRNPIGWLLLGGAILSALTAALQAYATAAPLRGSSSLPGGDVVAWMQSWMWFPGPVAMLTLVTLLFPDGNLPARRFRWIAYGSVVSIAIFLMTVPFDGSNVPNLAGYRNPLPLTLSTGLVQVTQTVAMGALIAALAGCVAGLVFRYRRAGPVLREQLKWFFWAAPAGIVLIVAGSVLTAPHGNAPGLPALGTVMSIAGITILPVAVGIAILRYRLYDIDRIISRTLAYASVTGILAALYLGLVLGVSVVSPLRADSPAAVAISTLAVAAAFGPLRRRIQASVDRRFNRARYDAARTLEDFSHRLRSEVELSTLTSELLAVIGKTVQPQRASLWLRQGEATR